MIELLSEFNSFACLKITISILVHPLQSHLLIKPCQSHSVNGQKNFMTVLCRDKELPPYKNGNRCGAIAPIITESSNLIHYKEKGEFFFLETSDLPDRNIKYKISIVCNFNLSSVNFTAIQAISCAQKAIP